ncbi:rhodanese-like domain-containing protein [Nitrosomonas sp. Is37]|uniref:rhodanese-like domain-containing protein n=1 Tax=Nitrosomonas sp. Is37 TaxID=3080535 RepID=UPI00294ABA6D|nr:rhodanese-like domain-containing protein [Nitrosomonas sp. Is37]MDV6343173.1 rhodanese-like domain-containing protein [Nitrosomonas sp. Is37]
MKKYLFALLFLFLPAVSAIATENIAPKEVFGAVTVDTVTAKRLYDQGYIFIDVRKLEFFNYEHIRGAQHLDVNSELFTAGNLNVLAEKNQAIVFYGNGIHSLSSSKASKKAAEWGWRRIYYYREGFPKWKEAGHPVE